MPPASVVNGAIHSESIPDLTAYRLFFVAANVSPDATDAANAQQAERLARIQMSGTDLRRLRTALATFNQQYADLITNYNASVNTATANHGEPDSDSFLRRRDALVQATVNDLRSGLSTKGFGQFVVRPFKLDTRGRV